MELNGTKLSCRRCANTLIDIAVPPSPTWTPSLFRTSYVPDDSEILDIKRYISDVDHRIDTLDSELELLSHLLETARRTREEMQRARITHQMLLSPIRRLPQEILAEIFWLSCSAVNSHTSRQDLFAPFYLGQVCSLWRTVAYRTLELWSQIRLGDMGIGNQSLLKEWILRSGTVPLTISVTYYPKFARAEKVPHMLRLLIQESSRWKSASICIPREMILAHFSQLHGHLPLLESIHVDSYEPLTSNPPIDFVEDAPNLRRLELEVPIQMDNLRNTLNRLTHLRLSDGFSGVAMYLNVLTLTPNLMELILGYNFQSFQGSAPPHPMYLMHLQRLQFDGVGNPSAIFDHLETPSLNQISLTLYDCHAWLAEPPWLSFLIRSSYSLRYLHIHCANHGAYIPTPNIVECLRLIPGITTLLVEGACHWVTDEMMENLILKAHEPPLLPKLEKLEFTKHGLNPWLFADMVGPRCSRGDTDSRCSKLRAVRVGLVDSPTFEPGNRQAWVDCFEKYRKEQGLSVSVTAGYGGRETIL